MRDVDKSWIFPCSIYWLRPCHRPAYLQIAMSSPCHRHVIDMTSPMSLPLPCYCHVIAGSDPTCETIGSGRNTHAC